MIWGKNSSCRSLTGLWIPSSLGEVVGSSSRSKSTTATRIPPQQIHLKTNPCNNLRSIKNLANQVSTTQGAMQRCPVQLT
ncbi:hypothetical protein KC19_VG151900 [Ceratodon purpureus]|uniref:Uncharacterized protein n=1 Tax=Ceratodon purpureus TaxID=3225 RepID=A0A8T0HQR7_CERPU|nr:hypothetical protein KC19_VG151900 [Ceratodon purpureus]